MSEAPSTAPSSLAAARAASATILDLFDKGLRVEDIVEHLQEVLGLRDVTFAEVCIVVRENADGSDEPADLDRDDCDEPAWNSFFEEDY